MHRNRSIKILARQIAIWPGTLHEREELILVPALLTDLCAGSNDLLRENLRPLEPGEQRIQGTFLKLDCDNKGVAYFSIQAADRVYKIRATALQRVQLTAYTPAPPEVSCGPRKSPENVVLTYRPTSDAKDAKAKIDGDAVALELVPKDFLLK